MQRVGIYSSLHKHCKQGSTGTFFMLTNHGDGAGITLTKGKITGIGFKAVRGADALELICRIKRSHCSFKHDVNVFLDDSHPDVSSLLPTGNLLDHLRNRFHLDASMCDAKAA